MARTARTHLYPDTRSTSAQDSNICDCNNELDYHQTIVLTEGEGTYPQCDL